MPTGSWTGRRSWDSAAARSSSRRRTGRWGGGGVRRQAAWPRLGSQVCRIFGSRFDCQMDQAMKATHKMITISRTLSKLT